MAYTKKDQLIDRINSNYNSFKCSLRGVSRSKLFEGAERIAAVKEAHRALTEEYEFEDGEVDFFLLFRDPLTIVADAWESRDTTEDFPDMMFRLSYDDRIITDYPLLEGSYGDILYIGQPDDDKIRFYCDI